MDEQKQKIAEYYDITLPYYKRFWHRDSESNALHYGFWERQTKTMKEALLNENKFLAEMAQITSSMKVLDAGCGIGGSAIWLAKNTGAYVVGITLSKRQLIRAEELAKEYGVDNKTEFYLKDFLNTGFSDNSFDVVWAIESACYAANKGIFLKEAFRILKEGGRIVIADGFLKRDASSNEKKIYADFLKGLVLPNLAKIDELKKWLKESGFRNIKFWDKSQEVKRSSRILYTRILLFYPIAKLLHLFHFIPELLMKNSRAGIAQWKIAKSGFVAYGVFYGEK